MIIALIKSYRVLPVHCLPQNLALKKVTVSPNLEQDEYKKKTYIVSYLGENT